MAPLRGHSAGTYRVDRRPSKEVNSSYHGSPDIYQIIGFLGHGTLISVPLTVTQKIQTK